MINEHNMLGIIPARGHLEGVPGNNIEILHNNSLITYTLEAAQFSKDIDQFKQCISQVVCRQLMIEAIA